MGLGWQHKYGLRAIVIEGEVGVPAASGIAEGVACSTCACHLGGGGLAIGAIGPPRGDIACAVRDGDDAVLTVGVDIGDRAIGVDLRDTLINGGSWDIAGDDVVSPIKVCHLLTA